MVQGGGSWPVNAMMGQPSMRASCSSPDVLDFGLGEGMRLGLQPGLEFGSRPERGEIFGGWTTGAVVNRVRSGGSDRVNI